MIPRSLPSLIHELDGHFSRFIRLRDMVNGKIPCFICGKKMTLQEAQCMHFVDRDKMSTRYDERNCHSGCEECNCFDSSHHARYAEKMRERYGTIECMDLLAKARSLQKFMRHEIEDLIDFYKSENRQSKSPQNLQ